MRKLLLLFCLAIGMDENEKRRGNPTWNAYLLLFSVVNKIWYGHMPPGPHACKTSMAPKGPQAILSLKPQCCRPKMGPNGPYTGYRQGLNSEHSKGGAQRRQNMKSLVMEFSPRRGPIDRKTGFSDSYFTWKSPILVPNF